MSVFLDSSALVKLYAEEEGSAYVRGLSPVAVSMVARVEVPAALWRKSRGGELTEADAGILAKDFEADLFGTGDEEPVFAAVSVSADILNQAAMLLPLHRLRAYDAVQLASAIAATAADPECQGFVCFDRDLAQAAAAQGLDVSRDRS